MQLPSALEQMERETQSVNAAVAKSAPVFLKSLDLISESYLAQVLLALWDSGVYEYACSGAGLKAESVATELELDAEILRQLLEYLTGRGLMALNGDRFVLTANGRVYWNYITRGALTSHLGGYNALLTNLGPLLRKEIAIDDERLDRSGRLVAIGAAYTLLGT
jgi:hypothetical protein